MTSDETFRGWPKDAFTFYERLGRNNTKTFWTANKATYDDDVVAPMRALSDAVADEFGPLHLFRPYRDVRFSKEKVPYKDHQGAITESEGGTQYYVQLSADGVMVGGGMHTFATDQLERFRAAVDLVDLAEQLDEAAASVRKAGFTLSGEALKTAPRGVPKDHHHVEWMRFKGLYAWKQLGMPAWMSTAKALGRITDAWRATSPVDAWLETHVGPSTLPPDEERRR